MMRRLTTPLQSYDELCFSLRTPPLRDFAGVSAPVGARPLTFSALISILLDDLGRQSNALSRKIGRYLYRHAMSDTRSHGDRFGVTARIKYARLRSFLRELCGHIA